jgi:predicted unusual protein kinase regulating ubiquinone biosynthesis (AarF/ABC1/UbiB family)
MAPGMDVKAMTREIRERLTDELDYEHEAQQHRAFARSWRAHPFIYVPPVVTERCSEHVLVSEWVEGIGFEEVKQMDRATRDRFGEIVFRFFFGSLYRNGHFSGDPHPGNYRLMDDGRVAFIDFGMTKRVDRADLEAEIAALRFLVDHDVEGVHRQLGAMGFYDPADEQVTAEAVFEHFHDVTRWYIEDRDVSVDRELVAQVLIDFGDPRSRHWQLMRRETMPPQAMLARRMEALTLGVLGQLEATANWHRIAREWLFGDPPSTELGRLEQPFHDRAAA